MPPSSRSPTLASARGGCCSTFTTASTPGPGGRGRRLFARRSSRTWRRTGGSANRSRSGYRKFVEAYLKRWLDRPLREITREDVERRHAEIAEEVAERGKGSGGATANAAMRGLRVLYNFALERDASMPANPVRLRRQWFSVPRRTRSVVNGELPVFYRAVMELENPVARDYLLLLLFTGLRRTEAARLTWADVDLPAKVIRIPGSSTKSGRKLDLPITAPVMDLLRRREADGREHFVFAADSRSGHIEEPRHPLEHRGGEDRHQRVRARPQAHLRHRRVRDAGRQRASDQDAGEPRPAEGRHGRLHHGLGGEPAGACGEGGRQDRAHDRSMSLLPSRFDKFFQPVKELTGFQRAQQPYSKR